MAVNEITPKHDSTLGLIFRLNALWADVDVPAKKGEYLAWNNILDRIYCNLLYRNDLEIEKDEGGKILSIKLSENDAKEYRFLSSEIAKCQKLHLIVKGKTSNGFDKKKIVRSRWYKSLMLKDIWLRKYMNSLNLYIKETKSTPGSAMFGGGK